MKRYLTVSDCETEIVIQRSRFISFAYHIENEEEALDKLKGLRKKYFDATHICYAYVADTSGNKVKFSDDGEPSGTAGQPILEVIKAKEMKLTLVAVVRYFGGIKLGAGGLTRAYSSASSEVLKITEIQEFVYSKVYKTELDFAFLKKFEKSISNILCKIIQKEYNNIAVITIACPDDFDYENFVTELSAGRANSKLLYMTFIKY